MRGSGSDGAPSPRRRGWRGFNLAGLTWWQKALVLLPLTLVTMGGAIGGGIGGWAAGANLSLARTRRLTNGPRALAMVSVALFAVGVDYIVADAVHSAFSSHRSATSGSPQIPVPAPSHAANVSPHIQPPGDAGWQTPPVTHPPGVALDLPTVVHDNGPALSWRPYGNNDGKPGDDLVAYDVYRGESPYLTTAEGTLIAQVGADQTGVVDTTVPIVDDNPLGTTYYYRVFVRTKSGNLIDGPGEMVHVPPKGQTDVIVPADAAMTLASAQPNTVAATHDGMGRSELEIGYDNRGFGITRTVFDFGPLPAAPAGGVVVSAHLNLWGAVLEEQFQLHALSRSFVNAEATWRNAGPGIPWRKPGGDYTLPAGPPWNNFTGNGEVTQFDATAIVRGWVSSPASEHGVLLKAMNETQAADQRGFVSGMDADNPAERPALVITYKS